MIRRIPAVPGQGPAHVCVADEEGGPRHRESQCRLDRERRTGRGSGMANHPIASLIQDSIAAGAPLRLERVGAQRNRGAHQRDVGREADPRLRGTRECSGRGPAGCARDGGAGEVRCQGSRRPPRPRAVLQCRARIRRISRTRGSDRFALGDPGAQPHQMDRFPHRGWFEPGGRGRDPDVALEASVFALVEQMQAEDIHT